MIHHPGNQKRSSMLEDFPDPSPLGLTKSPGRRVNHQSWGLQPSTMVKLTTVIYYFKHQPYGHLLFLFGYCSMVIYYLPWLVTTVILLFTDYQPHESTIIHHGYFPCYFSWLVYYRFPMKNWPWLHPLGPRAGTSQHFVPPGEERSSEMARKTEGSTTSWDRRMGCKNGT